MCHIKVVLRVRARMNDINKWVNMEGTVWYSSDLKMAEI